MAFMRAQGADIVVPDEQHRHAAPPRMTIPAA
jgi:hypothetical protein